MTHRILTHLRHNTVAYVALFFAIGGGGAGAAITATATSSTAIRACVSKKNGAVYIAKRCTKSTKALTFNQRGPIGPTGATGATGATPFTASGVVGTNGVAEANSQGLTVQAVAVGEYQVTLTGAACGVSGGQGDSLVVSPLGSPGNESYGTAGYTSSYYVADVGETTTPAEFDVYTGEVTNGSYASADDAFNALGSC